MMFPSDEPGDYGYGIGVTMVASKYKSCPKCKKKGVYLPANLSNRQDSYEICRYCGHIPKYAGFSPEFSPDYLLLPSATGDK